MSTLAVYSTKGGVGKTALAVNLAWLAATISNKRTLLWDLDPQAASTFILAEDAARAAQAKSLFGTQEDPTNLIVETSTAQLHLLPADRSLRESDRMLRQARVQGTWHETLKILTSNYDFVIVDCSPSLGSTNEHIIRSASAILVPMIPSPLAVRACDEICEYLGTNLTDGPPVFPVFTMVDRRRVAHRAALAADPGFPVIPMASAVEMMADNHGPVGKFAPHSAAALAFLDLWKLVERHIT